jgi:hypothetical protein
LSLRCCNFSLHTKNSHSWITKLSFGGKSMSRDFFVVVSSEKSQWGGNDDVFMIPRAQLALNWLKSQTIYNFRINNDIEILTRYTQKLNFVYFSVVSKNSHLKGVILREENKTPKATFSVWKKYQSSMVVKDGDICESSNINPIHHNFVTHTITDPILFFILCWLSTKGIRRVENFVYFQFA